MSLATLFAGNKALDFRPVSLNGIAASALSALRTNSAALGVVSNNVANLNTPGYARRIVNEQTLALNGQLVGVDIANVERVIDQFLQQENLAANGTSSQYDTMAGLFSQLNGLLGGPGDNQSLATGLTNLSAAYGLASQSPTSSASYTSVLNALNNVASQISNVYGTITTLQGQVDKQVASAIPSTNALIQQIYQLNQQIKNATASGSDSSALADQRDVALTALSKTMGIRINQQSDGGINVTTTDGINLVSNTYAVLSYAGGTQNGTYGNVQIQDFNPLSGGVIGQPIALDPHLSSGALKGLIDMRDQTLSGLAASLGNYAQTVANAFNAQANANAAYPPPPSLTGRDTGLLTGDSLNFAGKTTIAVTDPNGVLVSRIDVDFGAGTLSVDGGGPVAIGSTIGSFTTALNGALGGNGSASFTGGKLSISATGGNGILVQDDATTPSSRGGTGFSQFFGLNDLFHAASPSILATGLSASDASGLPAGGVISLSLKGPDGDIVKQVSVTTTAGQTVGNVITALNTAMGGAVAFTLNSDGSVSTSSSPLYAGYQLNVTGDTTQRGATGMSFTQLFGIGDNNLANQAAGFAVSQAVVNAPQQIGFSSPQISPVSVAGDTIVVGGDNSGAIALQNVITNTQAFKAAGGISAQTSSLSDYAAAFYQNVSTQSNTVTTNQTTQDDRLQEALQRMSSNSGVNLDEELTNLTTYQRAYSAGARLLTVVDQLYNTLLQIQ
jgi:flagellar hook-associated protein 1 FlgK